MAESSKKARFWWALLYPENMVEDWQDVIGERLQVPYAYCVHDQDKDGDEDERKTHVHLMLAFSNTTTYKHAMTVFSELNAPGKRACNTCKTVYHVRNVYDYLIHNTDDCRKKGKHQYFPEERITGNNFDIGAYEQIGAGEKVDAIKTLCQEIIERNITNFVDFYQITLEYDDAVYFEVLKSHSGLFERMVKGVWLKEQGAKK